MKMQYVFRVLPVCFTGTGSASDDSDLCWTHATSPPGIPEAIHVTHDTIQLMWSKPVYGSENVDHYVVSCSTTRGLSLMVSLVLNVRDG